MDKNNYFQRNQSISTTREIDAVAIIRTLHLANGEALTAQKQFTLRASILDVADVVAIACNGTIKGDVCTRLFIEGSVDEEPILGIINAGSVGYDPNDDDDAIGVSGGLFAEAISLFNVRVTGTRKAVKHIFDSVGNAFKDQRYAKIMWWYHSSHGPQSQSMYLPPLTTKVYPEFYPDIEEGPHQFVENFLKADEVILLLAGAPGTGKTTLLRHMIAERSLSAHVCYDETLMSNDRVFQSFLMGDGDVLVIEDADTILSPRERDGNKLMSRFLNVSDGLIKLPNKKLVFTTNLSDFGRIDPALMRPGRCYGVLHTRPLNLQEAQAASKVGGFPTPTERKEWTLADLFNQGKKGPAIRRIGLTG